MLSDLTPLRVSLKEREILSQLEQLSARSGSHSPSLGTMQQLIPEINVDIDSCYLSNPLATDLFWSHFNADVLADPQLFKRMLEAYPSQNREIAERLSTALGIDANHLFIANGATEAIQAVIHNYSSHIHISIPTFSPYYEFAGPHTQVTKFQLDPAKNFAVDPEEYVESVLRSKADTAVLISPNNPDGYLIPDADLEWILSQLSSLRTMIVDESFVHFADRPTAPGGLPTLTGITQQFENVTVVKSMSKDFGIAGIRAGYAIMQPERVDQLLAHGYLWNTSGLAEYFFSLFDRSAFLTEYRQELFRYRRFIDNFTTATARFDFVRAFDTSANFQLMQIHADVSAEVVTALLLLRHGIYVRNCSDKIGLDGEFLRVAIRTEPENAKVLDALADILS
ncbi:MAG: histidinol-phosphate transaminase [Dehalococcoidia bacterium]|jgi:histidinol-phosphate/aromatic aminotransferase/cobyric acid decarboxylase-like protein|nr:aminotransferase [Chloroflexota bacterium]MDP7090559.1 histidinol-phosphate transaminase [Dehalococcoidia bacterium]MDP7262438.1 histidinol-phosphate transaminase [Dehalococcoidia bacterium]|tara:strand:- start:1000 stop:2187 length:1188 start_codon:yes stop_codon:yes gene_type:complete